MTWLQVRIALGELPVEALEQALLDIGAVAIDYSDAGDDPIFEPAPGDTALWETTQLSALFDGGASKTAIQLSVAKSIAPATMPRITFDWIEDQDWVRRWQQNLRPMRFGTDLWVCAPGIVCPDPQATIVKIEPGLGFGTGTHATTRLCLEWLSGRSLRGKTVLDFGCGSGILAIASLALGASESTAVDIDDHALAATRENARRNDCIEQLQVLAADQLEQTAGYDVIVANILSSTLIELQSRLQRYCRDGADIALSGILTSQATGVISAYEEWITLVPAAEQDGWVILAGTLN